MPSAPALAKSVRKGEPAPAPGLNRIDSRVKITGVVVPPKKDEIPVVQVEGDTMKRYNEAVAAKKDAEDAMTELKPILHETAMQFIFDHNCKRDCTNQLTSVKLQDVTIDEELPASDPKRVITGEITRVSFTSRYGSCDADQVEATFSTMKGRNVNDYVTETVAATFDDKVFLDAEGNFDAKVFKKFQVAIERVATELGLKNEDGSVKSPLSTKRVLITKEGFHEQRFKDFNSEENFVLAKVLPNTIQCSAVRTK
jgi:hypothetical protein